MNRGNQNTKDRSNSRSRSGMNPQEVRSPQLKKVGNFLIDMDKQLGKG